MAVFAARMHLLLDTHDQPPLSDPAEMLVKHGHSRLR